MSSEGEGHPRVKLELVYLFSFVSCLLSVLTASGRLWLLTPPGSQAMQWQISTQLSARIVPEKDAVRTSILCVVLDD